MNATTQLLTTLRSGACLKLGGRSHRFFLLKNSTQLPADQAAARKLASDGTLRPHGIDSHGNYVFALSAKSRSLGYAHWPERAGFAHEEGAESRSLGYAHWPEPRRTH